MNQRERVLAVAIAVTVLVGGAGFIFDEGFLKPLGQRDENARKLAEDIEDRRAQLQQVLADRPRLERYRRLSLPADIEMDRLEYEKYFTGLMTQSGFESASFSIAPKQMETHTGTTLPGARKAAPPPFTRLGFTVQAHGTVGQLVKVLDSFYRSGFLHQIRKLSIQRTVTVGPQQRPDELDINLEVEALVVNGADKRPFLLPTIDSRSLAIEIALGLARAPTGLALAAWAAGPSGPAGPGVLARPTRNYADIAGKNIFTGAPESGTSEAVEVTRFVYLTDITFSKGRYQAFLYDRYNNHTTRLRSSAGFDRFRISDNDGKPMVHGQVVHLDARYLIFKADGRFYTLHVGQNLEEALRKPLSRDEVDSLTKRAP